MLKFALPIIALGLASCAATPQQVAREEASAAQSEARLATALAGLVPGNPTACINPRGLNTTTYGDKILYRQGRRAYLATTNGGCFGLSRDDIIVTRTPSGQLCRGDIITTVDRNSRFPSGSCSFGDFTPYTRAPRR